MTPSRRAIWREAAIVSALSLHGLLEGAAVGLEDSAEGVWTMMTGEADK